MPKLQKMVPAALNVAECALNTAGCWRERGIAGRKPQALHLFCMGVRRRGTTSLRDFRRAEDHKKLFFFIFFKKKI